MPSKRRVGGDDEIGPWSEDKLDLLGKYLHAYSQIMNSQKLKGWLKAYHYVDAFAGSGRHKAKRRKKGTGQTPLSVMALEPEITSSANEDDYAEQYISGSPLRALGTDPPFDVYWFIEKTPERLEKLNSLQNQLSSKDMRIREGDCNQILRQDVVRQVTKSSRQRGFVFLDPYGLQVEWPTMEALAQVGTFDIFINFSLMGITRLLKRDEPPEQDVVDRLNKVMGDSKWLQEIYQPPPQLEMFPQQMFPQLYEAQSATREMMRAEWLADLYAERIKKLFPHVSMPVIMSNSKRAPLYALFLASHNKTAVDKIGNQIFARYERLRKLGK